MLKPVYSSPTFTLSFKQEALQTRIDMQMNIPTVNTNTLPSTYNFLSAHFPEALSTECFNDNNFPFKREVRSTEIGHLFEHVLLEYVRLNKASSGFKNVVVNGRTSWNWKEDPYGLFHISIDVGKKDFDFLIKALEETIVLIESLLSREFFGLSTFSPSSFRFI